jgi:hypothetical protein
MHCDADVVIASPVALSRKVSTDRHAVASADRRRQLWNVNR